MGSDWGGLRFVLGFVLLPFLYIKDCMDVHREFASAFASMADKKALQHHCNFSMMKSSLYVFDMDWWLVGAIAVFLTATFTLGDAASYSTLLTQVPACSEVSDGMLGATPAQQVQAHTEAEPSPRASRARGILNAYGCVLGLAAVYFVQWQKSQAYFALRKAAEHSVASALIPTFEAYDKPMD